MTAVGINGFRIVGSTVAEGVAAGYLLKNGRYTLISYPGATLTTGRDINDQGHIVGSFNDGVGFVHEYLRVQPKSPRF